MVSYIYIALNGLVAGAAIPPPPTLSLLPIHIANVTSNTGEARRRTLYTTILHRLLCLPPPNIFVVSLALLYLLPISSGYRRRISYGRSLSYDPAIFLGLV